MNGHSLSITYAGPHVPDNPWWVSIEQLPFATDVATVSDAASLLDALYQLDPCTETAAPDDDAAATVEDVADAASATLDLAACAVDADGSVRVQIKVIRSHQDEPYRLHVAGGSVVETKVSHEELIQHLVLDTATELTLGYPVAGAFSAAWQPGLATESGAVPEVKRNGNVLYWDESATGTLRVAFLTVYDLVTVQVDGVGGEMGEALVRVVFHGLAEEMTPDMPEPSELDRSFCNGSSRLSFVRDRVTCYKDVTVHVLCSCSKSEEDSYSYEKIVECPEWVEQCPGTVTDCMALVGSESVDEYIECDGDNQVSGSSRIWLVSSKSFYKKTCCEDPSGELPQCWEKTTSYQGGQDIVYGRDYWVDLYGPYTRFAPVGPAGGICGKHIVRQVVRAESCCDGAPPIHWDASVSPDVMAPNSVALIGVTGGVGDRYYWTVEGSGFQFQNGSKAITTTDNRVLLSALALACGTAIVTVTDRCSVVSGAVRSTAGSWSADCYCLVVSATYHATSWDYYRWAYLCADGCSIGRTSAEGWTSGPLYTVAYCQVHRWNGTSWVGDPRFCSITGWEIDPATWGQCLAASPLLKFAAGPESGPTGDGSQYTCGDTPCQWIC